jgi:putative NIF3 family GTP cyclohydrolase 1 type 2
MSKEINLFCPHHNLDYYTTFYVSWYTYEVLSVSVNAWQVPQWVHTVEFFSRVHLPPPPPTKTTACPRARQWRHSSTSQKHRSSLGYMVRRMELCVWMHPVSHVEVSCGWQDVSSNITTRVQHHNHYRRVISEVFCVPSKRGSTGTSTVFEEMMLRLNVWNEKTED